MPDKLFTEHIHLVRWITQDGHPRWRGGNKTHKGQGCHMRALGSARWPRGIKFAIYSAGGYFYVYRTRSSLAGRDDNRKLMFKSLDKRTAAIVCEALCVHMAGRRNARNVRKA